MTFFLDVLTGFTVETAGVDNYRKLPNGNLGNHLDKMGNGKWGKRHPVKRATENWATNLRLE